LKNAVVLAGGKGRRLEPYTTVLPKPLVPVGDYPILELILRQLKKFGWQNIYLAVGHLAGLIEAYFGNGEKLGINLKYSYEEKPLGTVGPLKLLEGKLSESFLVMNGDVLTDMNLIEFEEFHRKEKGTLTIAVNERSVEIDFGVIQLDGKRIVGYKEKPKESFWVSMGIYFFEKKALRFVPEGKRFDIPDLVIELIKRGENVCAFPYRGFWLDIGREEDLRRAQKEYENRFKHIFTQ